MQMKSPALKSGGWRFAQPRFSPKQHEALRLVADGRFVPGLVKEEDGWYARWRVPGVENPWIDDYIRKSLVTPTTEDAEEQRHETLHDAWMSALQSRSGRVAWNDAECAAFAVELVEWSGAAETDVAARKAIAFTWTASGDEFSVACPTPRGKRMLKALGQAAYVWGPLRDLSAQNGGALAIKLSRTESEDFIRRGAAALREAGYTVDGLPESAEVSLSAEATLPDELGDSAGDRVKLTVKVAGEAVTADEIRFLLEQGSTLVFFRGHWIEVDRNILKEALRALEKGAGKNVNLVSFALGIGHVGSLEVAEFTSRGWLRGLVNSLRARGEGDVLPANAVPKTFRGTLRDYQQQGVAWLKFLTDNGFGALLADEMGLGKTIQTIAWMLGEKGRTLVVAPLTLLANWQHEISDFAPTLDVYIHHGGERHFASGFRRRVASAEVVLVSYGLFVREYSLFAEIKWNALVLDEAQIAKNPKTQIARAIRALSPAKRLALTGTPIENSPRDLWSLEDFLNPGFLGDEKSFRDRFVRPLAFNPDAAVGRRLRHALEPFVLRRLKSDSRIASELGEKREIREYCELDAAARRAYEATLADFRVLPHTSGDALALLTELKLICDGEAKIVRLLDLLELIFANGESALVFTQYAKVGATLARRMEERFGRRFPFLHGALSASAREGEIRFFNRRGNTAFILSLKAGGFGLNLTKATHVIHFDRWWNPAVESQATDRAHRIGQKKTVFVHLMVTSGTVEERVDEILSRKETLKNLIADGEEFWKAVKLS